ncbi:hypothetical protein ABZU25_22885 [Micromonospora sp. NPDC005215]
MGPRRRRPARPFQEREQAAAQARLFAQARRRRAEYRYGRPAR